VDIFSKQIGDDVYNRSQKVELGSIVFWRNE